MSGQFQPDIGRARDALARLVVPATLRTDPLAAARAAVEVILGFRDGLAVGVDVGLANPTGLLVFATQPTGSYPPAPAEEIEKTEDDACDGCRLPAMSRHVAAATLVAAKLELVAATGAQVFMRGRKAIHGHD